MDQDYLKFQGPLDRMRNGFNGNIPHMVNHPVQTIEAFEKFNDDLMKRKFIRCNYGVHMVMKLASEEALFRSCGRLPGLRSNSIHAQTFTGQDSNISFSDYIGGTT
jgi:hypothetical protein